jgi:hypothetical protein
MRTRILGGLLMAVSLVLSAGPEGWGGEPIHIGMSAPLTGNFAEYGQNWQKAISLAVEWINAAGGVNGRPIGSWPRTARAIPGRRGHRPEVHRRHADRGGDRRFQQHCLPGGPAHLRQGGMVQLRRRPPTELRAGSP